MAPRPGSFPVWATSGTITVPSGPKQALGWIKEKPSFQFFNWWMNLAYLWFAYLDERKTSTYATAALITAIASPEDGNTARLAGVGTYTFTTGSTLLVDGEAVLSGSGGQWILSGVDPAALEAFDATTAAMDAVEELEDRVDDLAYQLGQVGVYPVATNTVSAAATLNLDFDWPDAKPGDVAMVSVFPAFPAGLTARAFVQTMGQIRVQIYNPTAGSLATGAGELSIAKIGRS